MNSELTRQLIERRIAKNNEGIAAMDRDGISNHLQRELYDGWKQDNAIYEFALAGLSVQPRPIEQIGNGELFVAFGDAGGRALMKRGTGRFSQDDIFYTDTMRTEEPFEVISAGIPISSLPTPRDK